MRKYRITASLVLYKNNLHDLNGILLSVKESSIHKLYIIDNSPSDEIRNVVLSYNCEKLEYIYGQGNIGYGRANNIAIKRSFQDNSKYHIVLNPDIIFSPNVIDQLVNYMDEHENVGLILPKVVYPNGDIQYLCKLLPTPIDIFARRILPSKYFSKRNDRYEMRFTGYDKIWNCPILSGCFMFLRVDVLKTVRGFDPQFFMYFEDFDLMRRIHNVSKTIYYPYVSIIHNHAAEHRHNSKLLKESIKSAIKYFNKWGWFFDKQRSTINRIAMSDQKEL